MGHEGLLAALRLRGETNLRRLWEKAEQDLATARQDCARQLRQARRELQQSQARKLERLTLGAWFRAQRRARQLVSAGRSELADRLHVLARAELQRLRSDNYPTRFAALVRELPDAAWESVRVHPDDLALTTEQLPNVPAEPDPTIVGGYIARADRPQLVVNNTLERRLEQAWPELLARLLAQLQQQETVND